MSAVTEGLSGTRELKGGEEYQRNRKSRAY